VFMCSLLSALTSGRAVSAESHLLDFCCLVDRIVIVTRSHSSCRIETLLPPDNRYEKIVRLCFRSAASSSCDARHRFTHTHTLAWSSPRVDWIISHNVLHSQLRSAFDILPTHSNLEISLGFMIVRSYRLDLDEASKPLGSVLNDMS
jgi:hypothetical protein